MTIDWRSGNSTHTFTHETRHTTHHHQSDVHSRQQRASQMCRRHNGPHVCALRGTCGDTISMACLYPRPPGIRTQGLAARPLRCAMASRTVRSIISSIVHLTAKPAQRTISSPPFCRSACHHGSMDCQCHERHSADTHRPPVSKSCAATSCSPPFAHNVVSAHSVGVDEG